MADSGNAPTDAASRAPSNSDSDDEEVAQAFNSANHNNGSNRDHDEYFFGCQSRDQSIYESKHWLMNCLNEVTNDAKKRENGDNRNNDNNGSVENACRCVDNNSSFDGDDEGCVGLDLVENGDYDSGSTEGCDADDDDDLLDDEEDFLDDDDPIEGRDVDNDGTTDGHDDGGNGSTEREDTDNERSQTSRKIAFSRFLQRSNAFIRHMLRKAFDPTQ